MLCLRYIVQVAVLMNPVCYLDVKFWVRASIEFSGFCKTKESYFNIQRCAAKPAGRLDHMSAQNGNSQNAMCDVLRSDTYGVGAKG